MSQQQNPSTSSPRTISTAYHHVAPSSGQPTSPVAVKNQKERDRLFNSISSSSSRRRTIQFDDPRPDHASMRAPVRDDNDDDNDEALEALEQEPGRDARDNSDGAVTRVPGIDFDGLSWPSIGTRARLQASPEQSKATLDKMTAHIKGLLECLGEDPEREGLTSTPKRYAEAMMYFTKGYEENLRDIVNGAVFHENHDEMVIVRDIDVFSLCEHHLVPFTGKMHIGYIPNRRVLGLSKLARIAEMFSRRLQVQERLTKQVALAISEVLHPKGVAVVMESAHLCMVMRGVEKTSSKTLTSCMLGCMRSQDKTRAEFLTLLNRGI